MSNKLSEGFETINDLGAVCEGEGDAAVCAEQVGTAAVLGAAAGATKGGGLAGAAVWGGTGALGTYLNSTACGNGQDSLLTLGRKWLQQRYGQGGTPSGDPFDGSYTMLGA